MPHSTGCEYTISIHALREEGDLACAVLRDGDAHISIHALREEGDLNGRHTPLLIMVFLSTPSVRRATSFLKFVSPKIRYFYPRPP